jgi:hypothetical protein
MDACVTTALSLIPQAVLRPGTHLPAGVADVLPVLNSMSAVSTPGEHHRLLRRVDSKFVIERRYLPELLQAMAPQFELLTGGNPAATYLTVYFDTADRALLTDHLRGRRPRHKLRVRHYLDRRLSFLELKSKTPSNRTEKQQRGRDFGSNDLTTVEQSWAAGLARCPGELRALAWTSCQRLTLLHRASAGRVTIDLNVSLGNADGARCLRDRVLLELKQERTGSDPAFTRALRAAHAQPVGLSKYVAAMMHSEPRLAQARFATVLGRYARPEFWRECYS